MAYMQVEMFSQALHMAVGVDVILPQPVKNEIGLESGEKTDQKYPILWLLHGATDDQTTWQRRTSIERYVAPLGLAVVMPSAHLSSYTDMAHGGAFYTYIVEELPVLMRQFFPLSEKREESTIRIGMLQSAAFQPEQMAENLCRITAVCLMIRNGI